MLHMAILFLIIASQASYTGLICDGIPNYTNIYRALSEIVEENSILCTDKHRSYIPFVAQHILYI